MKNLIKSFIRILINIVIWLLCFLLIFILGILLFSKLNSLDVEDTVTYVQSFIGESSDDITLTNKNSVNISSNDSTKSDLNINNKKTLFYYNQLDETSKTIYDTLNNNIDNLKEDNYIIKFNTTFNKLLNTSNGESILNTSFQTALDAFFHDHPELFYIDLTKMYLHIKYTTIGQKTTYIVSISPEENTNYLYDGFTSSNVDTAILEVENIKNNLIKSISSNSTDYQKALQVHDALVKSLEYDSSTSKTNTHNIYGALVEKKVVCEGYAKTFKYIMDSLDVECILVTGIATNSTGLTESHMWNYIKLNNKWYGVDVTWDDPIIVGGTTKNIIRHNFFCKGYNTFNESHKINNKLSDNGKSFNYPVLNSSDYK